MKEGREKRVGKGAKEGEREGRTGGRQMGGGAGRQAGRGEPRVQSPVRVQSLLPMSFTLLHQHTAASRMDHHMDHSLGGHRQTVAADSRNSGNRRD